MITEPIDLSAALSRIDQLWSPRIVTRVNDYDVRIVKVAGEYIWHSHADTDEFFLVLDGELNIALRDAPTADADAASSDHAGLTERVVTLRPGSVFVVPRGVEHKPFSTTGASVLLFEPTGTMNVGDHHDSIPDYITATAGQPLDQA